MTIKAKQVQRKSSGETMQVRISFDELLVDSDVLTGTPTAVEVTTSDLTITTVQTNVGTVTILGKTIPIANAVTFLCAGGTAGTTYTIAITVSTVGSSIFQREIVLSVQ
tara:strand:- start:174 stop:500 length:327 start_codon:yes stop_codon:yes gene_type:complete